MQTHVFGLMGQLHKHSTKLETPKAIVRKTAARDVVSIFITNASLVDRFI